MAPSRKHLCLEALSTLVYAYKLLTL